MKPFSVRAQREAAVWEAVAVVKDPELDEPVIEMGFVERIEIDDDGSVALDFRLPTYWCSPNFAFLMLDGLRAALDALPWRPSHRITLHDHLFADEVNQGVAAGKPFSEIFEELAPGENLDALRLKFQKKAFQRRQEGVLAGLRGAGWSEAQILALDLSSLEDPPGALSRVFARYTDAFRSRFPEATSAARVIVDWSGAVVDSANFADHFARLRSVRINMEFNGALCRGLKEARYREKASGELTLVDFLPRSPPACVAAG